MFIPNHINKIIHQLQDCGYDAYVVGGCVRDYYMGDIPHDYDICTSATPDEMKVCLGQYKSYDTGIQHGTVSFMADGEIVEVTTFRTETGYADGRHPDTVTFVGEVESDLSRRDLTINAMAYNDRDGLIDLYGGYRDIESGIIRCVGKPTDRFDEDGLRILRAIRFASRYGFDIAPDTASAIHACCNNLRNVSFPRIYAEIVQIMDSWRGDTLFALLMEFPDVFAYVFPSLAPCVGYDQNSPYHIYDLYEHMVRTCCLFDGCDYILRMAALIHDVGKPSVCAIGMDGYFHYIGHEAASARLVEEDLRRLCMSTEETRKIIGLVRKHDTPLTCSKKRMYRLMSALDNDKEQLDRLVVLQKCDAMAHAEHEYVSNRIAACDMFLDFANEQFAIADRFDISSLDISGDDFINAGYVPGPKYREVLEALVNDVLDGRIRNEYDDLLCRAIQLFES